MRKIYIVILSMSLLITGCSIGDSHPAADAGRETVSPGPSAAAEPTIAVSPSDEPAETPVQFVPEEDVLAVLSNAYGKISNANSVVVDYDYMCAGTLYGLDIGINQRFKMTLNLNEKEQVSEGILKTGLGEIQRKGYRFGNYVYLKKNNSEGYFIEKYSNRETDEYFESIHEIFDFLNPEYTDTANLDLKYRESREDYLITGTGYQHGILSRIYPEDKFWLMEYAEMTFSDMETKIIVDKNFNVRSVSIKAAESMYIDILINFLSIGEYSDIEGKSEIVDNYPFPEGSDTQIRRLNVLFNTYDYEKVIGLTTSLLLHTDSSEDYYQFLIDAYIYSERYKDAEALGADLVQQNPTNHLFIDSYCLALLETGETDEAFKYAHEALRLSYWSEFAYEVLARIYFDEEDYYVASSYGSLARMHEVSSYNTCILTVESYIMMELYDNAEAELDYFIEWFGESEDTTNLRNRIISERDNGVGL